MSSKPSYILPAVGEALMAAGVKRPAQKEIVWRWLKDNPRKTLKDIRLTLSIPPSSLFAVVSGLLARKMIEKKQEFSRPSQKYEDYYSAIGDTYELLPVPVKKQEQDMIELQKKIASLKLELEAETRRQALVDAYSPVTASAPGTESQPGNAPHFRLSADDVMAQIPLREAKLLFLMLQEMFEPASAPDIKSPRFASTSATSSRGSAP